MRYRSPQPHLTIETAGMKAQQSSDRLFQAVWDSAADAMVLSDARGIVVAANPAYCALYGYRMDEVLGKTFAIIFPDEERDGAIEEYRRIFAEPDNRPTVESRVQRSNGEECLVEVRYTFIVEHGERTAMLSIIRDVTERARLAEARSELQRQKDELLLLISHDLKTPLTSIRGRAQLVAQCLARGQGLDSPRVKDSLEAIDRTVIQMKNLVDELAETARRELGQLPALRRSRTDLVGLVHRVAMQQQTFDTHHMTVSTDCERVVGLWDGERLERVLGNVLSNAVKYTPTGGDIRVAVTRDGNGAEECAVVTVEDRGLGIPTDDLPHVFEHFYRGANVDGRIDGTGIGLAGAKKIVEQHGGTIDVDSVEGHGATITVRLPGVISGP
ncbi:MAG: hypothetical protein NVS2B16_25970 [Chloroflexota bacterium]